MHGRRRELHRAGHVGAGHRQARLVAARRGSGGTPPRRRWRARWPSVDRSGGVTRSLASPSDRPRRVAPAETPDRAPSSRARAQGAPVGEQWAYEPKYDGFRAIAFVDGDEWTIQSRSGKPLLRYFPELRVPARALRPRRRDRDRLDDDGHAGLRRASAAHPSRRRRAIEMLAEQTPARYVAFDLLALDDDVAARASRSSERRAGARAGARRQASTLTPLTREPDGRRAVAAGRRGRRRQGPRRPVQARPARPGWSRSSASARSTRSSSAGGRARRRARSAR